MLKLSSPQFCSYIIYICEQALHFGGEQRME